MDDDVLPMLERYEWPGNVRELRNTVERMAILTPGNQITSDSVPMEIRLPSSSSPAGLQGVRDAAERERIVQALDQTNWNVSGAARILGVERTNLHKRIRALGLNRE
jgi:two-component system nitrogen regulation response regulator NtrX